MYHKELRHNLDQINNNLKESVKRLNWKNIDFPASVHDYAFFEKNNEDIALNVLYVSTNTKQVRQEYISIHNFTKNKQVVLLKISYNEKWHFTALKSIRQEDNTYKSTDSFSRLMRNISSTHHQDFYCYGCFHSFRTQSKLEEHNNLCKNHKYCDVKVPKQGKNFITHKFGSKALRINDVIYLDLECILEDCHTNHNDKSIPWTIKKNIHSVCGYSITHVSNHNNECITDYYHGKDSLEVFCNTLTVYAKKIK